MQLEVERSEALSRARSEAGRLGYQAKAKHLPSKCQALAEQVPLSPSPSSSLTPALEKYSVPSVQVTALERDPVPYERIVNLYHEKLPELPRCLKLTAARRAQIRSRWKGKDAEDLGDWESYFDIVRNSKFLMGGTAATAGRKVFLADIDWLTKEANFVKVLEGKYS
jgi:hypothetical protein